MSTDALASGWAKVLGGDRKQFDMFFDKMMDGFAYHKIVVDKNGTPIDYIFLEVNHAFEKMTGLKRERIIGKKVTEVLHGIEHDPVDSICVYGKVALTGEPVQFENHAKALGKWYNVSAYCPQHGHFVALFEDITERKKAEDALRVSEDKANALIKYAPTGIYEIDYRVPKFKSVNDAMCKILGYTREELLAINPFDLLDEESRNRFRERIMKLLSGQKVDETVEFRVIPKDRHEIYAVLNVMFTYENGKPESAVVIAQDITERKRTEKELWQTKNDWERTFDSVPDFIAILDNNFKILRANRAMAQQLGVTPEKAKGLFCYQCVHGLNSPPDFCPHILTIKDKKDHTVEVHEPHLGGDFLISTVPLRDENGCMIGSVHVPRNITESKKAGEAVRENEQRLKFHTENIPLAVVEWDRDFVVTRWAGDAEKMFGWKASETIGKPIMDLHLIYEPDIPIVERTMGRLTGGETKVVSTNRNITKDGRVIHCTWYNSVLLNDKGKMASVFSFVEDCTSTVNAEKRLEENNKNLEEIVEKRTLSLKVSEEKYRSLFDSIDEGFCIVEMVFDAGGKPSDYKFVEINQSFERQTGLHDAKGKLMRSLAPNHEEHWFEIYGRIAVTGEPMRFTNEAKALNRWYDVYAFPIGEGKIRKVAIIFNDITERKIADQNLLAASIYSRSLIEASLDPLVTISKSGKITDVNEATEEVTGCSREDLIGSDFSDYFTEPGKAREGYRKVFSEGLVKDYPLAIRHKSGRVTDVLYNASTYKDPHGEIRGVFAAARDITAQKKAEEQELEASKKLKDAERLAAIGATAGMVGHDIRNPLQAITSDVYLVKEELSSLPDSGEKNNAQESLTEIEKNIDYINKIVADLQDFARPLNPHAEETDLKLVIGELLKKNGLPENVKVTFKIEAKVGKVVADSSYINRIMYNLVTNAVQAMPKGGKLSIHVFKEADDVIISVKDTGVGIPEKIRSKLFTPMFTTKSKGQGFGLSVVKRMTEALGGTVTFESKEGKGTTFIVRLPHQKC